MQFCDKCGKLLNNFEEGLCFKCEDEIMTQPPIELEEDNEEVS